MVDLSATPVVLRNPMAYIENPKTKGSGVLCAIPQTGTCPIKCDDCFFQSGRSYLEPLEENLPNLPDPVDVGDYIVRMNDGNDSNVQREIVLEAAKRYKHVFFNTSIPKLDFPGPVVLTVNPGKMTDKDAHLVDPVPKNLMFVRFRVNMWNLDLCDKVVEHYTSRGAAVVLTFMAYYVESVPEEYARFYTYRKRTLNSYWVITEEGWGQVVERYAGNEKVYTCGKDAKTHACKECKRCATEYFHNTIVNVLT